MNIYIIILSSIIMFLAGFVQGITATGSSLIAVPILVLFIHPRIVIPMIIFHSIFMNIYLIYNCRSEVKFKRFIWLTIFGITGIPFGTRLLAVLNEDALRIFIGTVIVLAAAAFLSGFRKKVKNERIASIPVGLLSGLLNGSISMSGPPIVFFFTNQEVKKNYFRGNLSIYFLILNLVAIPLLVLNGIITTDVLKYTAYFFPALIAGTIAGNRLSIYVQDTTFRQLSLLLILVAGFLSIITGIF